MRSVMEDTVEDLYPGYSKQKSKGYMEALEDIVNSNDSRFTTIPKIMMFRNMIKSSSISTTDFLASSKYLYLKFSTTSSHEMAGYGMVSLPTHKEPAKINQVLGCAGIKQNRNYTVTMQLFLRPRGLPPKIPDIPHENKCCVRMYAVHRKDVERFTEENKKVSKEDICNVIFPSTKSHILGIEWIVHEVNIEKTKFVHYIEVNFGNAKTAKKAVYQSNQWLNDIEVGVEQIPCSGINNLIIASSTEQPSSTLPQAYHSPKN